MKNIFYKFGAGLPEAEYLEHEAAWMLLVDYLNIDKIRISFYEYLVGQRKIGEDIEGHVAMLRLSQELTDEFIAVLPVTKGNEKRLINYLKQYPRYIGYKRLLEEYSPDADTRKLFCQRAAELFPEEAGEQWREG